MLCCIMQMKVELPRGSVLPCSVQDTITQLNLYIANRFFCLFFLLLSTHQSSDTAMKKNLQQLPAIYNSSAGKIIYPECNIFWKWAKEGHAVSQLRQGDSLLWCVLPLDFLSAASSEKNRHFWPPVTPFHCRKRKRGHRLVWSTFKVSTHTVQSVCCLQKIWMVYSCSLHKQWDSCRWLLTLLL